MINSTIRKAAVVLIATIVVLAGLQWWQALILACNIEQTGDALIDMLRGCRTAQYLRGATMMLGISVFAGFSFFWFFARRLGSGWRVIQLASLTVGSGLLSVHLLLPTIAKAL